MCSADRKIGRKILDSRWRGELDEKAAWLRARDFLEMLAPRIEPHGTALCFSPFAADEGDFRRKASECYMLTNAIDDASFGRHMSAAGLTANGESGHSHFRAARDRLELFHIDEPGRVPLGASGTVDHFDMRRHLSAINYRGWVSIVQSRARKAPAMEALMESVRFFNEVYLKPKPGAAEDERLHVIASTLESLCPAIKADGGDLELVAVMAVPI